MPKSVRLTPDQERRLDLAAKKCGISPSALIRKAIDRQCQDVLGEDAVARLQSMGVIGAFTSTGEPSARDIGGAFADHVASKHAPGRRRNLR